MIIPTTKTTANNNDGNMFFFVDVGVFQAAMTSKLCLHFNWPEY